ncbi:MAG: hypothetical protein QOJ02_4223 [Acidobacteriota bacterium]|jgi:hypothetical protein|nr:hypothetical protein [Acidobacteriota bacterium]
MNGLFFEDQAPVIASPPNRADIACFVGLVGRRNTALPATVGRWLYEQGWTAPPYGRSSPPRFRVGGIVNPSGLAVKLRAAQDPVSEFIRTQLETQTLALLQDYNGLGTPSLALETALVSALNELLETEEFYDEQIFRNVMLSAETESLIEQTLRPDQLKRLNYLLLAQAYPRELGGSIVTAVDELLDLPVPIDTWEIFDWLFAWDKRPVDESGRKSCTTYMGAAVRSFFSQGGRKCYVVRVGDPLPLTTTRAARLPLVEKIIPGYPIRFNPSPADRASWQGIGHLFGLPDTSFLCMPDLADLFGAEHEKLDLDVLKPPPPPEQFVECSENEPQSPEDQLARRFPAPRCDEDGYQDWSHALWLVANMISRQQREVQLVAALPIPQRGMKAEEELLNFLLESLDGNAQTAGPLAASPSVQLGGLASAFVQLAYPWVRSLGSGNLPEGIESPDAVLVGILARNALTRGSFHSAASLHLADVYETFPSLQRHQMVGLPRTRATGKAIAGRNLLERVSLFGMTARGLRLLSDVTTSLDESYRPASVNRLVSIIVRAARRLGEESVFEASGERLWLQVKQRISDLLAGLLAAGALRGKKAADAYQVRCDRSTMSQNDLDQGRVITYVQFDAAVPIERITVALAMDEGGQVSLVSTGEASKEAA